MEIQIGNFSGKLQKTNNMYWIEFPDHFTTVGLIAMPLNVLYLRNCPDSSINWRPFLVKHRFNPHFFKCSRFPEFEKKNDFLRFVKILKNYNNIPNFVHLRNYV